LTSRAIGGQLVNPLEEQRLALSRALEENRRQALYAFASPEHLHYTTFGKNPIC